MPTLSLRQSLQAASAVMSPGRLVYISSLSTNLCPRYPSNTFSPSKRRRIESRSLSPFGTFNLRAFGSSAKTAAFQKIESPAEPPDAESQQSIPDGLAPSDQKAYARLRPILDDLPGPIDWAVAYGSGVRHQANTESGSGGKPPMTDYLLSVPCTTTFHRHNMARNPTHYPLMARLLGPGATGWLNDRWGAGVWYVTMVQIKGLEVKYGVISTERLKRDLEQWDTLYVAGRLHKPVLPLILQPSLQPALEANTISALRLSLLLLPPKFTELDLFIKIAGLSYAGDPRMSVPGAENPDKVKNIVSGQGAMEAMRQLYLRLYDSLGVEGAGESGEEMMQEQSRSLRRPDDEEYLAAMMCQLPRNLQRRVLKAYGHDSAPWRETGSGKMLGGVGFWRDVVGNRIVPKISLPTARKESGTSTGMQLEGADVWRAVLLKELQTIIRRPALTQSLKGLFTAGLRKSILYAAAKFGKWLAARRRR